jgi:hypothetical protein
MSKITRTITDGSVINQWGPAITISSKEEGIEIIKKDLMNLIQMNMDNPFDFNYNVTSATYTFCVDGNKHIISWQVT